MYHKSKPSEWRYIAYIYMKVSRFRGNGYWSLITFPLTFPRWNIRDTHSSPAGLPSAIPLKVRTGLVEWLGAGCWVQYHMSHYRADDWRPFHAVRVRKLDSRTPLVIGSEKKCPLQCLCACPAAETSTAIGPALLDTLCLTNENEISKNKNGCVYICFDMFSIESVQRSSQIYEILLILFVQH